MTRDQARELREAAARNPDRPMVAFARSLAELIEDLPPSAGPAQGRATTIRGRRHRMSVPMTPDLSATMSAAQLPPLSYFGGKTTLAPRMVALPCTADYCDRPAVAYVVRRHGTGVVLLVRRDHHRTDHPVGASGHGADGARCLDHAHDELDRALEIR